MKMFTKSWEQLLYSLLLPRYNKVVVQVSCGVCTIVPKKNHLQPVQNSFLGEHTNTVQVQGSGDSGREHDAESRTPANKYTTKDECVKLYGVLKREKCADDV